MKPLLLLVLLISIPPRTPGAWFPHIQPTYLRLEVGETRMAHVRAIWSGVLAVPWKDWVFDTTKRTVAVTSGRMTSSMPYDVSVTGTGPGFTYLKITSFPGEYTFIEVVCGKEDPIHPAEARVVGAPGKPVTLEAVTPIAHRTTFTWYRGHVGDQSSPIAGSGPELSFIPQGRTESVWVLATTPCSSSTAEFLVEVPVKRRAVRV